MNGTKRENSRALDSVHPRPARRRVVAVIGGFLTAIGLGLWLIPWQQTVIGNGKVIVYSAMDRPQSVEALIPGRIVEWRIQEGDAVTKGQIIAKLADTDSKFLDVEQPARLTRQRNFARTTQQESGRRITELESQRRELTAAREEAISVGLQAIEQALARERASRESVRQADRNLEIARQVAMRSAKERTNQAGDRVDQARQAVDAANQQWETTRLRLARVTELEAKGLRSRQDLEFGKNDEVKARTDVARAEKALEIARRDVSVGTLAEAQTGLETDRAAAVRDGARANLDVAQRDVTNARLNLNRLRNDTAAGLARVGADILSAKESLAKNSGDVEKVEMDLGNLKLRTGQQTVVSPANGRVVRLLQVGAGATVKAGDQLAVVVPDTADRAVELILSDNDIPLLSVGRPVRLQFAGWPAAQIGGFPSVAVGTFGGTVSVIDAVDDGLSRYRVIVKPDRHLLPSGRRDPAWPSGTRLRPGAEVQGWVMLDTVPLGFELWRQFNGFPASVPKSEIAKEKEKDKYLGPVKLKQKA